MEFIIFQLHKLMRTGGKTKLSIFLKLKEDFYIIKKNNLGGYIALINKIFQNLTNFTNE